MVNRDGGKSLTLVNASRIIESARYFLDANEAEPGEAKKKGGKKRPPSGKKKKRR